MNTRTLRALTIGEPYASLIMSGEKWVENRTWPTNHRGLLAIHAGKGTQYLDRKQLAAYPAGCVLGIVELVACTPMPLTVLEGTRLQDIGINPDEFCDHEHTEGPWCWILRNPQRYRDPQPAKGKQGLWSWTEPDMLEVV